jgi:hypothetical protein
MDIKEAATKLNLSERHLRRLITSGAIPAKKVKKMVEVEVWDIPDEVAKVAEEAFAELGKHEHFGQWMLDTMKSTGLSLTDISKRTRLPISTLLEIAKMPGYLSGPNVDIEEKIGKVLMRADIERRCKNV